MSEPTVSKCANPDCDAKFRRLGEGRLYLRPSHTPDSRAENRVLKALWVCSDCSARFNVRFDEAAQTFVLIPANSAAA